MDKPNYFDVTVSGTRARAVRSTSPRGARSAIDGRLDWRRVGVEDGSGKRRRSRIVADNVQFLDSRGDGDGGGGGGSFVPAGAAQSSSADFPSSPTDDDIPF